MNPTTPQMPAVQKPTLLSRLRAIIFTLAGLMVLGIGIVYFIMATSTSHSEAGFASAIILLMITIGELVAGIALLITLAIYVRLRHLQPDYGKTKRSSLATAIGIILALWVVLIAGYVVLSWLST